MTVEISSEVMAGLVAQAAASPEVEVCGLLLGGARQSGRVPGTAVVLDPERAAAVQPWMPEPVRHDEIEVQAFLSAPNIAADPATRFEVDPAVLLAGHRAARRGGPWVVGCYHSHPRGPAAPSACDAASAAPDGQLWLILGQGRATLWRAVAAGSVHGRFDPVAFTCTIGNRLLVTAGGVALR